MRRLGDYSPGAGSKWQRTDGSGQVEPQGRWSKGRDIVGEGGRGQTLSTGLI